jgi:hypothetical protein
MRSMQDERLILNPFVKIREERSGGELVGLNVVVPVRGEGFRVTTFNVQDDPALIAMLARIQGAEEEIELELTERQIEALAQSGFLVAADSLPLAVTYSCTLDDAPLVTPPAGPLVVNPSLRLQRDGALPAELTHAAEIAGALLPGAPMAWVRDPRSGTQSPFWLEPAQVELLERLRAGQDARTLDERLLQRLVGAGIVVAPTTIAELEDGAHAAVEKQRQHYLSSGYVLLPQLLPAAQLRALRRYYGALVREGMLKRGDVMVERRYVMPDEGCARLWHQQLADVVQRVVGEPIKPSYSYLAIYEAGAALYKHVDREQCEFSITFLVDYSPEPADVSDWPLLLDVKDPEPRAVAVHFAIGDGLLYLGRTLPHYRHELPPGRRSAHIFFHYVRADFSGSLI